MTYCYEKTRTALTELEDNLQTLTDEKLRRIAEIAIENTSNIVMTIALPHFLITRSVIEVKQIEYLIQGAVATKNYIKPKTPEGEKQLKAFVKLKFEQNEREHSEQGRKILNRMRKKNPYIENAIRTQALNSLVNTWTIFESTSKEIWVYLLNNFQDMFLKNIIESRTEEEVEGIIGKSISIDLLGRYGFNVNNKLGNILSYKYDFTSCLGIKKAFSDLDKKWSSSFAFLNDMNLLRLQYLRNLVVHNAGIIDETYIKKTGISQTMLGKKEFVTAMEYQRYDTAAIRALIKLFKIGERINKASQQNMKSN